MAKATNKKGLGPRASGLGQKKKPAPAKNAAPAKKPAAKKPAAAKKAAVAEPQLVMPDPAPRAERAGSAVVCAQCDGTVDGGTLRIVLEAGGALHPGCTFGWTLDHFADNSATADWMAQVMQRSRLSPEDRAELLQELGAPS
jgi:hypothetical protein